MGVFIGTSMLVYFCIVPISFEVTEAHEQPPAELRSIVAAPFSVQMAASWLRSPWPSWAILSCSLSAALPFSGLRGQI